jgi:WxcM-like, C-terminal
MEGARLHCSRNELATPVSVEDCVLVDLPKVADHRGNLTYLEAGRDVPFEVRRVFYIYDVPAGESRGGHAHRTLQQFLICLSGSFDVEVDDGASQRVHHLNRPWRGLYLPPLIWARETHFDPGTVCLVLTSDFHVESDNIRDYSLYRSFLNERDASSVP